MSSIVERFNQLPEDRKETFVIDTLDALIRMTKNPKQAKKTMVNLGLVLLGKRKPTEKQLKFLTQVTLTLFYSLKPEYQYRWAYLYFTGFQGRNPKLKQYADAALQQMKKMEKLKFVHVGLSPETFNKVNDYAVRNNIENWEQLFESFLSEKVEANK